MEGSSSPIRLFTILLAFACLSEVIFADLSSTQELYLQGNYSKSYWECNYLSLITTSPNELAMINLCLRQNAIRLNYSNELINLYTIKYWHFSLKANVSTCDLSIGGYICPENEVIPIEAPIYSNSENISTLILTFEFRPHDLNEIQLRELQKLKREKEGWRQNIPSELLSDYERYETQRVFGKEQVSFKLDKNSNTPATSTLQLFYLFWNAPICDFYFSNGNYSFSSIGLMGGVDSTITDSRLESSNLGPAKINSFPLGLPSYTHTFQMISDNENSLFICKKIPTGIEVKIEKRESETDHIHAEGEAVIGGKFVKIIRDLEWYPFDEYEREFGVKTDYPTQVTLILDNSAHQSPSLVASFDDGSDKKSYGLATQENFRKTFKIHHKRDLKAFAEQISFNWFIPWVLVVIITYKFIGMTRPIVWFDFIISCFLLIYFSWPPEGVNPFYPIRLLLFLFPLSFLVYYERKWIFDHFQSIKGLCISLYHNLKRIASSIYEKMQHSKK